MGGGEEEGSGARGQRGSAVGRIVWGVQSRDGRRTKGYSADNSY